MLVAANVSGTSHIWSGPWTRDDPCLQLDFGRRRNRFLEANIGCAPASPATSVRCPRDPEAAPAASAINTPARGFRENGPREKRLRAIDVPNTAPPIRRHDSVTRVMKRNASPCEGARANPSAPCGRLLCRRLPGRDLKYFC